MGGTALGLAAIGISALVPSQGLVSLSQAAGEVAAEVAAMVAAEVAAMVAAEVAAAAAAAAAVAVAAGAAVVAEHVKPVQDSWSAFQRIC